MGNNCCGRTMGDPEVEACKSESELLNLIETKKNEYENEAQQIQVYQENPIMIPIVVNPAV